MSIFDFLYGDIHHVKVESEAITVVCMRPGMPKFAYNCQGSLWVVLGALSD